MKSLAIIHRRIQGAISNIIGIALAILLVVILAQTFTRYVIFYSLPWSEELSRYLYILMIMLGINLGVTHDGFVRIDIIDYFTSDKTKARLAVYRDLVTLVVGVCFFWSSLGLSKIGAFQKSPAMQIRMSWMYYILAVGFALCILSSLLRIFGVFTGKGETTAHPETTEGGDQQ